MKISINELKGLIREEVKRAVKEAGTSVATSPANPTSVATSPANPTSADMNFSVEENIASQFQNLVQLMTNVGALIDNPNQSRPSLTGTIRSGDRALQRTVVQRINRMQQQIVAELERMASDRQTYEPNIIRTLTDVLAKVREVQQGMINLTGQSAEQQITALQSLKTQYLTYGGSLRRIRNRFGAFA